MQNLENKRKSVQNPFRITKPKRQHWVFIDRASQRTTLDTDEGTFDDAKRSNENDLRVSNFNFKIVEFQFPLKTYRFGVPLWITYQVNFPSFWFFLQKFCQSWNFFKFRQPPEYTPTPQKFLHMCKIDCFNRPEWKNSKKNFLLVLNLWSWPVI